MEIEETENFFVIWIDEINEVISFHAMEDFIEKVFFSHEECMEYVYQRCMKGYCIQ